MTPDVFFQIAAVGALATYAHLIMALWAPSYRLPRIDFSMGIAEISWGESFDGKPPYWMGFTAIHLNGILFAFVYATEMAPILPGTALIKGLIWGGILFVGAQLIFVPFFLKGGFFGLKHGSWGWATALVVHGVYGSILGWLCPIV